jgi:hypothetical protein
MYFRKECFVKILTKFNVIYVGKLAYYFFKMSKYKENYFKANNSEYSNYIKIVIVLTII